MSGLWIPEIMRAQRSELANIAESEDMYERILVSQARADRRRQRRAAVRAWIRTRTRARTF
jgi:hypothetical protein